MANPWFRLYAEFSDDAKVQMLPEAMQRRLIMLFCLRCKEWLPGLKDNEIAWSLRLSTEDLKETKKTFVESGFIDSQWNILNWEKRQARSDKSYERVKRYRNKREAKGLPRGSNFSDPVLFERDNRRCVYCLSPLQLCIDHVFPICMGGTDDYDNLAVACKSCNSGKAGRTPEMCGYLFQNKDAEQRYKRYVTVNSLNVTVTVTPQNRTDKEQNRIEHKESAPKASPSSFLLPSWINKDAWSGFEEMRKKIRAPLTDRARNGIVKELQAMCPAGDDGAAILDQSTRNSWRGVFPLKNSTNGNGKPAYPPGFFDDPPGVSSVRN